MSSLHQIEANRHNSQKRTGPRSIAGKSFSSMNALKSGIDAKSEIIRGEDPKDLDALKTSYYESLQPTRPEEAVFVDALVSADWLLRRLRKTEAETWERAFEEQDDWSERYEEDVNQPLCRAFMSKENAFTRLQRRMDAAQRTLHRGLAELRRLRENRPEPDPPPAPAAQPPPVTPSPAEPKPPICLVPPTHPQPFTNPVSGSVFSAPASCSPC